MADLLLASCSPCDGLLHDHGVTPAGLVVTDLDGTGIASVLARKGASGALAQRVETAWGIALVDGPRRVAAGETAFIGVGRGRWLATRDRGGNGFSAELSGRLDGLAGITDQSDGYALLRLAGPAVRPVLAKGVGIDLHPAAFIPGAAASTIVGHIGMTLWRRDDGVDGAPVFEVALFRSLAGSFWHWLALSAGEFGLRIEPQRG